MLHRALEQFLSRRPLGRARHARRRHAARHRGRLDLSRPAASARGGRDRDDAAAGRAAGRGPRSADGRRRSGCGSSASSRTCRASSAPARRSSGRAAASVSPRRSGYRCSASVPLDPALREAADAGTPVPEAAPDSEAAQAIVAAGRADPAHAPRHPQGLTVLLDSALVALGSVRGRGPPAAPFRVLFFPRDRNPLLRFLSLRIARAPHRRPLRCAFSRGGQELRCSTSAASIWPSPDAATSTFVPTAAPSVGGDLPRHDSQLWAGEPSVDRP